VNIAVPSSTPSAAEDIAGAIGRFRDALFRRKGELLIVSLVTFLLIQAVGFFWPGTFAAHSALLIQKARASAPLDADPSEPTTVISGGVTEEEVNSEIAVLTSREVLAATVAAAGLDRVPPPWYLRLLFWPLRAYDRLYARYHGIAEPSDTDRAIQGLTRSISAERMKDSNVLVVGLESGDPKVAEIVLNELLKHYMQRHIDVHGRYQVEPLFSTQAGVIERELHEVEESLQQTKREGGTVDAGAERDVQLKSDAALREELDTLRRRLAELDGKLAAYDKELAEGAARQSVSGDILDSLKSEALRLELEQIRMEARYKEGFPLLEENRQKLEKTRQALDEERAKVFEHNPTLVALDQERARTAAERAGVAERKGVLEAQVRQSRERLMDLDRRTTEATRSQRRIKALEERYAMYLSRGEKARIDSALDQGNITNVSIVQAASASPKPVRPKKSIVMAVSLVGGLLVGILRCAWLELRGIGLAAFLAAVAPPKA